VVCSEGEVVVHGELLLLLLCRAVVGLLSQTNEGTCGGSSGRSQTAADVAVLGSELIAVLVCDNAGRGDGVSRAAALLTCCCC
jgi:hypothetical protein